MKKNQIANDALRDEMVREVLPEREAELFRQNLFNTHKQTDQLFGWLLLGQWVAVIAAALWISPLTWIGSAYQTHVHVWVALFLGGAIVSLPVFFAFSRPGETLTRHSVAVAQMLLGSLLIHLNGGRIETHFHVFGSLAFLAFYRDWKVLVTGSLVVALDHCIRGLFFPQSVFGVLGVSPWRWLEHTAWVVFEDYFLIRSCSKSISEMKMMAHRQAEMEATSAGIEHLVLQRTAELREHQQRFRSAFDSASIGKALVGLDGRWIQVNPALCQIVGYSAEEMMTFDFQKITHPEDLHADLDQVKRMVALEICSYQMEKRYFHRDGHIVWILLTASLVLNDKRQPSYFVSEIQDITHRKEAEARLQLQYQTTRALASASSMNEAARAMLRCIRETMGWELGEFWLLNEKSQHLEFVVASRHANDKLEEFCRLTTEYSFPLGSGLPGRVWSSERPVWIPDLAKDDNFCRFQLAQRFDLRSGLGLPVCVAGRTVGVLVLLARTMKCPDVDTLSSLKGLGDQFGQFIERNRVEMELVSTSNRLKAVLDASTEASIIASDPHGVITVFNAGAERLLGYSAEEMIGKQTPVIIHDAAEVARRAQQLSLELGAPVAGFDAFVAKARLGGHDEQEWTYVHKEGSRISVSLVVTAQRDSRGNIIGYLGIAHDITKRKRTEAELKKAKENAEAANRMKSEFLANMSHEIRTPMNGILGMTRLTLGTPLTSAQREYLEMVEQSAESLLTIINAILDFSKIEAGKLDLDRSEFGLRDGIGDALKTLAPQAQAKGLELACRILPQVPDQLVGDLDRLRQIIVNLVGNAIKFTQRGEVVLTVEMVAQADRNLKFHFSISDTGIGIAEDKLAKIFEPFEQADGSTTRKFGGTGLGLTISARIVSLMGGEMWVESTLGQGSIFHFTAVLTLASSSKVQFGRKTIPALEGISVLIIDDNHTNRRILEELCHSWRMKPTAVESGRRGLMELQGAVERGEGYALLLLDGHMPEMDGFAVAAEMKSNPNLKSTAIMMLSSSGSCEEERCRQLGIDVYLTKPIKQSDLLNAINRVLNQHGTKSDEQVEVVDYFSEMQQVRPLSILLAEDYVVNQKLLLVLLEKQGHSVTLVGNGALALELARVGMFDLILMDVQMPEMDGLEATAAIRKYEASVQRRTPIIAITAHAMKGDRERCLAAGMDDYVSKPIHPLELIRAISNVLPSAIDGKNNSEKSKPICYRPMAADSTISTNGNHLPVKADALLFVGGDEVLLRELTQLFLEDCPRLLAEVQSALTRRDAVALKRAAHTIKGGLSNFGDRPGAEVAQRLETLGSTKNFVEAAELSVALENRLQMIRPVLSEWSV